MNQIQQRIQNNAPIVPGQSAAGLSIGGEIGSVPISGEDPAGSIEIELGAVTIWATGNLIEQIRVVSGYQGLLLGKLGIGSTLSEVESVYQSSVQEDEDDSLVVLGVPGLCIETEIWTGSKVKDNLDSRIVNIFVFRSSANNLHESCADKSNSKDEMRGSLHYASRDETARGFGRDDVSLRGV